MKEELDILSQKEYTIINDIITLKGSMEEKENRLKSLNVFDSYKNIHNEYTRLENNEALKRAVFIQWYSAVEPRIYTGIGDLSKESEDINIKKLIKVFESDNSDLEFRIMFRHYYSIGNWYFDAFPNINRIVDLLNITNDNLFAIGNVTNVSNRGQMSKYWESIIS